MEVHCFSYAASQCSGWVANGTEKKTYDLFHRVNVGDHNTDVIALTHVDILNEGNFQAQTYTERQNDGTLKILMGGYENGVKIWDLKAMYLCYTPRLQHIESGWEDTAISFKNNDWYVASAGETFSKRINFKRTFKSPKVVAFIYRFSVDKTTWPRIDVYPQEIDTGGFNLHLNTWSGE